MISLSGNIFEFQPTFAQIQKVSEITGDWILETGVWDDTGVWRDDNFWND